MVNSVDDTTQPNTPYPFRAFISYSHDDLPLVERLVEILEHELGIIPTYDVDIHPGTSFSEAIRGLIARSHLFIPVITNRSHNSYWVNQEIGYALALSIAILPIAIKEDHAPSGMSEMIAHLQAIITQPDFTNLPAQLRELKLTQLIAPTDWQPTSMVEIADWPETRTEVLIKYINWVDSIGKFGRVRTYGLYSSFSLPDSELDAEIWNAFGKTSDYHRHLLREERRALERHARVSGCSLIINPQPIAGAPPDSQPRLIILKEFLESMDDDKVTIVISPSQQYENIIIVGDYFAAESMVHRPGGYRQTLFHSHAPSVFRHISKFDQRLAALLKGQNLEPKDSRRAAIEKLSALIKSS